MEDRNIMYHRMMKTVIGRLLTIPVFIILFPLILSCHLFGGAASRTKAPCSSLMMRTENLVATSRSLVLSEA